MNKPTLEQLQSAVARKGYRWLDDGRPYLLNLFGLRAALPFANQFDDWFCAAFRTGSTWQFYAFPSTTDPGMFWLKNPLNVLGTAILKPGQYRDVWQLGLHKGKYMALVQRKPVTVFRDNDRDLVLDGEREDTGLFGINIHRANPDRKSVQVDKWSAGCQVLADPKDFLQLIGFCKEQLRLRPGSSYTYTLLEEADLAAEDNQRLDL